MLTKTPLAFENFLQEGKVSQNLRKFYEGINVQRNEFSNTPAIIEGLAKHYGVYDRCLERGLEGLLEVKTIRLYSVYYAAWAYAKWFGEQGTPGKVKPSEKGDFFHSVQSAAADVFVTDDKKLVRWLKQILVEDFEIICFEQFFEMLQSNS